MPERSFGFDEFTLDVGARKLWRGCTAIALPSRAFDALVYLIEHRDRLVRKNELIDAIWTDVVVTDDSLIHAISVLRRALADERAHPRYIETVPRRGYRFIGVVRTEPQVAPQTSRDQVGRQPDATEATPPRARLAANGAPKRPTRLGWLIGGASVAVALIALVASLLPARGRDVDTRAVLLAQPSPPGASIASGGVLSPDGRYLAFVARDDTLDKTALWVRTLHSHSLEALAGTEGASKPFWSPDARRIGFFANGRLMTADLSGQAPQTVAAVDVAVAGGTWGLDDTILFAVWPNGLYAVPATGDGRIETIAKLDRAAQDIAFGWPQFLPDGRRFLYQIVSLDPARTGAYVGNLDTRESFRLLATESAATFAAPRHLLHVENDMLIAEEIELERLELTGRASVVARGLSPPSLGADNVVSAAGELLAFQQGVKKQNLAWFDRAGQRLASLSIPTMLFNPRVSPDESRLVATSSITSDPGLWLASLAREEFARLENDAIGPLWAPDGDTVAFSARGGFDLLVRAIDGAQPPRLLISDGAIKILNDWTPDGAELVYTRIEEAGGPDLWTASADDARTQPLLATPFNELQARISPDGRWLAYASDESGVLEVYVQRYPELGEKRLVSVGGGGQPQWRADQRELFYLSADRAVMSVDVDPGAFGTPRKLFRASVAGDPTDARDYYAAAADGSKFLIDGPVEQASDPTITVIVHWPAVNAEPPAERLSRLSR
jgi:DNA-binding winged helix-turn-helix (wHTH) protein/Tol biopolymer transport system component